MSLTLRLEAFRAKKVLVVADLVADEFVYGRIERVSREAPVLILRHDGTDLRLGGGGNAAHNIRALGGSPLAVGILGPDPHGAQLKGLLRREGIDVSRVLTLPGYTTPVKTRILAGGAHSTKQQVVRIDRASEFPEARKARSHVLRSLRSAAGKVDAVLVSDYGFGLLTPEVVEAVIRFAKRERIPVTVDSRHALLSFRGMTAVTPNESEVEEALGVTIGHDGLRLEKAGRRLLSLLGSEVVLVTRGSDGMALFERRRPTLHIPIHGGDQVADVTGAGDTVIATFTLALAAGASAGEAARLANYAGGIVVMKRGTATVSAEELRVAAQSASAP